MRLRWELAGSSAMKFYDVKTVWDLSDHQLHLVSWVRFYASIYDMPNRPSDDIIDDDDSLDQWLVNQRLQNRKSEMDVVDYHPRGSFGT